MLYIAADAITAQKAYAAIKAFSGKRCALLTAKDDVLLYKDAVSKDALFKRICAVYEIESGADFVVCDVEAALALLPEKVPSIIFKAGQDYDYSSLPEKLVKMGYSREYAADSKGSFAVRGDILDIYPINCDNPVRIDFFGDNVEKIRPYDEVSGERLNEINEITIVAATDCFLEEGDEEVIKHRLNSGIKACKDANAYRRSKYIADDIISKAESNVPFMGLSFVMPLLKGSKTIFDIIPNDTLIVLDECKAIADRALALYKEHKERYSGLLGGGEAFDFSLDQFMSDEKFISEIGKYRNLALQTFTSSTAFFKPLKTYSFKSTPAPSYLNSVPNLVTDVKNWLSGGYRIIIFTGNENRTQKLAEALADAYIGVNILPDILDALRGVAVCQEELAHGIILHEAKVAIIYRHRI
jgi:transcription-repair coupling factor (superfamily II helicase)